MKTTNSKQLPTYWTKENQIFICDGKGYALTPELETICIGNQQELEAGIQPIASPLSVVESCPSYPVCSAPLCPLDEQSLKNGIWYPDEPICNNRLQKPEWIRIQRRIARKAKIRTNYFTLEDLQVIKRVINPKGHNPDLRRNYLRPQQNHP